MRIYLDVSALDRPFDDQTQERIRLESEAIRLIFARIDTGEWTHVSSEMVLIEITAIPDPDRQEKLRRIVLAARDIMPLSDPLYQRAESLTRMGFKPADAVHVAAAEAQGAHVLLSCDDRLMRRARRLRRRLSVLVANPLSWLREQTHESNP